MKKLVILALVGVLAVSLIAPATAAKKKKKKKKAPTPIELQFFMRRDDCGGDADNPHLSLTDAAEDVDCSYVDTALNDFYLQSGLLDPTIPYVATDGLPLTLDTSRKATGVISTRSYNGAGGGNATLDLELVGVIGGEEVSLGTFSVTYAALPTMTHTHEYEMELDAKFAGATLEGLTLNVLVHGQIVGIHGTIEHDEPVSLIKIPALQ